MNTPNPSRPAAVDALRALREQEQRYAETAYYNGRPDLAQDHAANRNALDEAIAALAAHSAPAVDEAKLRETLAWANDEIDVYTDTAEPGDETIEAEHPHLIHMMRIRRVLEAALAKPAQEAGPCNCPGVGKLDPKKHAPNCPVRIGGEAVDHE